MRVNSVKGTDGIRSQKLRYQGKSGPLLRAIRKCAMKGLELKRPEDVETAQEELDRTMARQGGGDAA